MKLAKFNDNFSSSEYPYKFVKVLKHQQLVEKETLTLICELDDAGGEVQWFKGDQAITPDKRYVKLIINLSHICLFSESTLYKTIFCAIRVQIKEDGRKRKLTIKDCKVTDAGLYSCVSNADKTEAEIVINCK